MMIASALNIICWVLRLRCSVVEPERVCCRPAIFSSKDTKLYHFADVFLKKNGSRGSRQLFLSLTYLFSAAAAFSAGLLSAAGLLSEDDSLVLDSEELLFSDFSSP
jgi:hypothetical protein